MLARRWYAMLALGPLLLLLAFLPSVTYLDHWTEFLGITQADEHEVENHAGHCHVNLAGCSEQPLPPDLSVTPTLVHFIEPELTWLALDIDQQRWAERAVAPPTEPPRAGSVLPETFV